MKVVTLNSNFSGIKTIIFYKWNSFIPTNSEKINSSDKSDLIEIHSSKEIYYYSGEDSSDCLDLLEYNIKFNPEKDKFKGFIKSNYFDSKSLDFIKDSFGNYNEKRLSALNLSFPQNSSERILPWEKETKFFGIVKDLARSILYLDIPGDEHDNPVWKIELYDEYINTNNSLLDKKGERFFLPYELLTVLYPNDSGEKIIKIPNSIITFGPEVTCLNNTSLFKKEKGKEKYSMYFGGSLSYYPPLEEFTSKNSQEWESELREITSKKLLKIIISPSGYFERIINLSNLAWMDLANPNRNQNKFSLRNDEFLATRDYFNLKKDSNGDEDILQDPISGNILATRKLDSADKNYPILDAKLTRLKFIYSSRKVYKESEAVLFNDYIYISLVSGNIGENPTYSSKWKFIKEYEEGDEFKYINSKQESLSLFQKSLNTDHYQAYVHVNNKSYGTVTPSGILSLRKGVEKSLKIIPNPEYLLSADNKIDVLVDGKPLLNQAATLIEGKEIEYIYTLPIDINETIDISINFVPSQKYLGIQSLVLLGKDFYEIFDKKSEIFVKTYEEISQKTSVKGSSGIVFEFYDNLGKRIFPEYSEFYDRDLIYFPDLLVRKEEKTLPKYPLRVVVDDLNSSHYISSIYYLDNSLSRVDLEICEDSEGKKYFEIQDNSTTLNLSVEITAKILNCSVVCNGNVDSSIDGSFVKYREDSFKVSFMTRTSSDKISSLIIYYGKEKVVIKDLSKNNIYLNGIQIARLDYNKPIYNLEVNNILDNIVIEINS